MTRGHPVREKQLRSSSHGRPASCSYSWMRRLRNKRCCLHGFSALQAPMGDAPDILLPADSTADRPEVRKRSGRGHRTDDRFPEGCRYRKAATGRRSFREKNRVRKRPPVPSIGLEHGRKVSIFLHSTRRCEMYPVSAHRRRDAAWRPLVRPFLDILCSPKTCTDAFGVGMTALLLAHRNPQRGGDGECLVSPFMVEVVAE